MYNFQVEDFHTYHVGTNGVLVHNAGKDYNVDQLLESGNQSDKGDLTKSGRAAQKHGSRDGSKFPDIKGDANTMNAQGNNILKSILNDPDATAVTRHHARYGEILEIKLPNGCGARFTADGKTFIGLIE